MIFQKIKSHFRALMNVKVKHDISSGMVSTMHSHFESSGTFKPKSDEHPHA